ncbi:MULTISPECIES: hypothetical protein [Priestia]|jgi:hypothetical protein|uniref:hypothetical protein n=1 Tax=Priestia TaxID=2800373 RepID=UPI0005C4C07F|nr:MULTISPECIES: hypothetical protein [Priestia]MCF8889332.1 hypothetical protein [Priestia megaterium]MDC0702862.1 hypothetical protein [Priestia sp. AB]MEB2266187.1 hypothetical protein [Priestia megaterium]MED4208232.1 hypothetical protein [Priestia megaterium]NEW01814.1 hypothetical protein [Priestia megaterium]
MVDKNWINAYVSKISGKHFELLVVQDIIVSFIEMLNVKLNDNQQPKANFNKVENEISFPDCLVSFKIQGSVLSLRKVLKSNYQVAGGIKIFDTGLSYHLKSGAELIEEVENISEALDRALSYLLLELK